MEDILLREDWERSITHLFTINYKRSATHGVK
jgi:hypothetical protein